jgi:hypothetical protein
MSSSPKRFKKAYTSADKYASSYQKQWERMEENDAHQQLSELAGNKLVQFWLDHQSEYPFLASVMISLHGIPHSTAQSEGVFSMLKKIYSEYRSSLCQESLISLLSIKMNNPSCCFDTNISAELLYKLKKSATQYNARHPSAGASTAQQPPE